MKKISYLLLVFVLAITGLVNVNAEGYASYREGDKITVSVNDTTKLDFYVIEDSNEENEKVSAIYAGVFENEYTYEAAGEYIETLEGEWTNVDSIVIPSMEDIFGEEVDLTESFKFTEPSWALSDYSYWTSTETEKSGETWVWTVETTLNGEGSTGTSSITIKEYLKPLINVSKSQVTIAQDVVGEIDESKEESPSTGDLDMILLGGAMLLCVGVATVAFKKTRLN